MKEKNKKLKMHKEINSLTDMLFANKWRGIESYVQVVLIGTLMYMSVCFMVDTIKKFVKFLCFAKKMIYPMK